MALSGQFGRAQFGTARFGDGSLGQNPNLTLQLSDSINNWVDTLSNFPVIPLTFSDSINNWADYTNLNHLPFSDSLSVDDTLKFVLGLELSFTEDPLPFDDNIRPAAALFFTFSDTFSIDDSTAFQTGTALSDSINNFLDAIQVDTATNAFHLTDSLTIADTVSLLVGLDFKLTDVLDIEDAQGAGPGYAFSDINTLYDGLSLYESDEALLRLNDVLFFNWADAVAIQVQLNAALSDTLNISDHLIIINDLSLAFNDLLNKFDALSFAVPFVISFGDTLSITDSAGSVAPRADQLLDDVLVFTDTISTFNGGSNAYGDSLNLADGLSLGVSLGYTMNDSYTLGDNIGIQLNTVPAVPAVSDSLSFSDSVQVRPSTSLDSYIRRYLNDVQR